MNGKHIESGGVEINQPEQAQEPRSRGAISPFTEPSAPKGANGSKAKKRYLEWYSPKELADHEPPKDIMLVGDMHIFRGGIFVLGGAPGVGKSFAVSQLAMAGAKGSPWFGLPVHRQFKTMILQAENGLARLSKEYRQLPYEDMESWVVVSKDLDLFAFDSPDFCAEFKAKIAEFEPDVIVLDPWSRATKDTMEKDYRAAFEAITLCLPDGPKRPALFIVAHTRKPKLGERVNGRGLLNLLSGSLLLGSVPRAVFILQSSSESTTDRRVVFTCCKNNNGEEGEPSAWERQGLIYIPCPEFDWEMFRSGGSGGESKGPKSALRIEHLQEALKDGPVTRKELGKRLMRLAGVTDSTVSDYLKLDGGKWIHMIHIREDGLWSLMPEYRAEEPDNEGDEEEDA